MSRRDEWLSTCWLLSYLSPYADDPALPGSPDEWKPILTMADRGLVLSGLAESLFRKEAEIPGEVREHLVLSLELHSLRNRIVQNEVLQLIGALNDMDIEPVVIKGATTLLSGGATLTERLMLDVDIWIPDPGQRAAALHCLEALGYRSTGPAEVTGGAHHYPPHFKPNSLSRVELHYDLFPESHRQLLGEENGIRVISASLGDLKFGVLD